MRLFLDSSVLLAACISARGASREIFRIRRSNNWQLLTTGYGIEEVLRNLVAFTAAASGEWARLRPALLVLEDVLTLDRPVVFSAAKDKPILFGALAWADLLLTLDNADFAALGGSFYGLPVFRPGQFLERERAAGRLRNE